VAAYSVGFSEVSSLGNVGVLERDIDRLCKRMQSKAAKVIFVYEAGPRGYGLQRQPRRLHLPRVSQPPDVEHFHPPTHNEERVF